MTNRVLSHLDIIQSCGRCGQRILWLCWSDFFVHSKVLESFGPGTRPWFFCSCMPQVLTTHPWLLEWSGQLIKPKPLKDLVVTVQLSPPWFSGTYFSHTVKAEIWNWREDLSICPRPNSPASVKDLHFPNRWSGIVAYMILNYIRTLFWISLKCGRMSQCWFWDAIAYTMLWLFRPFFRFRMFGSRHSLSRNVMPPGLVHVALTNFNRATSVAGPASCSKFPAASWGKHHPPAILQPLFVTKYQGHLVASFRRSLGHT